MSHAIYIDPLTQSPTMDGKNPTRQRSKAQGPGVSTVEFAQAQAQRHAAHRLMEQISASLKNVLTPKQAQALIELKGLELREVAKRALLDTTILSAWLAGRSPILPMRQLSRLQLVLGFEQSALCADRVHVLRLNERRLGKEVCAKHFAEVLPLLKSGSMSLVCDEGGRETWAQGARVHVVALSQAGYAVLVHQQSVALMASPVRRQIQGIAWAEHGSTGVGLRSELVVPKSVTNALSECELSEGDEISRQLAEHFEAAAQIKAAGGLRGLASLGPSRRR